MLLNNRSFVQHLLEGLFLNPEHPWASPTDVAIKSVVQRDFAECVQQVSLFPPGCEALKADGAVVEALNALVGSGAHERAAPQLLRLAISGREAGISPCSVL